MHSLRTPKWVFGVNTAPLALFMVLCAGEFSVVHTLLPAASVARWQEFGLALGLLGVGAAGYAGVQLVRGRPLGGWYSIVQLLAFSLFLCLLTSQANDVLPRSVPRWMVPTDPVLMAWTFLMPTLAHAMLALVAKFTPDDQRQHAGTNFVFAVGVPIGWWLLYGVWSFIEHLMHKPYNGTDPYTGPSRWETASDVILIVALVLSTLSFFFFLVRALFIMTRHKTGGWGDGSLVWRIIVTIMLPLLGLGLNNGLLFDGFGSKSGIFGNFCSPWFYVLAVLNGALLCVPDSARPAVRLLQLLGRSVLFGYTFYFFLVFLPFLPLSIPAIILIGTGFLLLAPLLLFVVHIRQLSDDVTALQAGYSKAVVRTVLVAGLAALPLFVTASFWHRRQVLHEALAYMYTPNYTETSHIDADALASTLAVVRQNKDRNRDMIFGSQQPYLSTYFNWLVLDNLMLSENKINELERVFSGPLPGYRVSPSWSNDAPRPDPLAAQLRTATAASTYDARQQAWVSWVNLEITNPQPHFQNRQYRTTITLPVGCWVSDYYLTIGKRQERGILAEKRAATWVFAQILNENSSHDPGLLTYRGPNRIDVRVYPVSDEEVRRTRIQFLHKEPCTLVVDGRTLVLGDRSTAPPVAAPVAVPGSGVAYVSGLAKQHLPLVQRRPYYHFLLDASAGRATPGAAYQARIAHQLAQPLPNAAPARFSLVNAATLPVPAGADWLAQLARTPSEGGFFLTGAIRRTLFEAQQHPTATYPVLVAVTDNLPNAVLDPDFEEFASAYPESSVFYVLGPDGRLVPHSLRHNAREPLGTVAVPGAPAPVRAWPNAVHPSAYLPANSEAAVVVDQRPVVPAPQTATANRWLAGLLLRGYGQWQSFHPETTDRERVPFIQASFRAGIMTPFTSFLALENDAQKAALYRKQQETLAANASLDTMENDEARPTETPIDRDAGLLLLAGALLAWWYLRRSPKIVPVECP